MRIVELRAENFKRLKVLSIKPAGSVVRIVGPNAAGKSSALDSICAALGGEKLCPSVPIRRGEDHAEVTVDLGELVATRRWTATGGSYLSVTNREGFRASSPQAVLDKMVGKLSFDPLAFMREKAKDQADTLSRIVGLDFTLNNRARQRLYDERTSVNREVAALKGSLARMPEVEAPDEPVSVAELLQEQERRLGQQKKIEAAQRAAKDAERKRAQAQAKVKATEERIAQLEEQLTLARSQLQVDIGDLITAEQTEDAAGEACMQLEEPDLAGIGADLRAAEGVNANVRAKKARAAEAEKLAAKEAEAKKLTAQIETLDLQKANAIAAAEFPVPGLGLDDEGVTFEGLPFQQAATSQQSRVSMAICAELNSTVRIAIIKNGNDLDEDSMLLLEEMAEKLDLQVWIERVAGDGETGILIEDGMVVGNGTAPVAEVAPHAG